MEILKDEISKLAVFGTGDMGFVMRKIPDKNYWVVRHTLKDQKTYPLSRLAGSMLKSSARSLVS